MNQYDIDIDACRGRQRRLIQQMQRLELDLVIVTQIEHVQWLAGPEFRWFFQPVAALASDGHLTIVGPPKISENVAADEVLTYEAQWHSTIRNDQRRASSEVLNQALRGREKPDRLGVEFSTFGQHLASFLDAILVDIEPDLYRLRRRKDPDELARIRMAIEGTRRMYERAREIIRPGVTELEVFNALQSAAVEQFGEMSTGAGGNDYQCCSRGGPPRNRAARDGELYILDLSPGFRGYFTDNCRTVSVSGNPTPEQQSAWSYCCKALDHVAATVSPGKSAKELFREAQAILDEAPVGEFDHHLGHGFGLFPHEAPHLNPNWDDRFEVGDVFTAEPGLYAPELKAGIRLEDNYLVTESGVELLTEFPLEL